MPVPTRRRRADTRAYIPRTQRSSSTRRASSVLAAPAVVSGGGAPIRFVPPAAASEEFPVQYEVRIFETGEVQTRPGSWHDLFNALVWLTFAKTKAVLNRHHYDEIQARRGERLRGTARDVLTLFDEGRILAAAANPETQAPL